MLSTSTFPPPLFSPLHLYFLALSRNRHVDDQNRIQTISILLWRTKILVIIDSPRIRVGLCGTTGLIRLLYDKVGKRTDMVIFNLTLLWSFRRTGLSRDSRTGIKTPPAVINTTPILYSKDLPEALCVCFFIYPLFPEFELSDWTICDPHTILWLRSVALVRP